MACHLILVLTGRHESTDPMTSDNDDSFRILNEQVRLLYANSLTLTLANLVALGAYLIIGEVWKQPFEQTWMALLGLVLIAQTGLILQARHHTRVAPRLRRYLLLPGMLMIGLLWTTALMECLTDTGPQLNNTLKIALIGLNLLFSTLLLSVDSLFSLLFILLSVLMLILNPSGPPLTLKAELWSGIAVYLLGLAILTLWMITLQQRTFVLGANGRLLKRRLTQTESELDEMHNRQRSAPSNGKGSLPGEVCSGTCEPGQIGISRHHEP